MGKIAKRVGLGVGGVLGLALLAGGVAATVFWFRPVGVNNYVNKQTLRLLTDSPELLTNIGAVDGTPLDFHSGKLGNYTKAGDDKSLAMIKEAREGLDSYCGDKPLKEQERLTCDVVGWFFDELIRQSRFDAGGYPISQLSGPHIDLPRFMTSQHKMTTPKLARNYLSRLAEIDRVLAETAARVDEAEATGVVAPDFVIEKTLTGLRAFIATAPADNPLVATLPDRLARIDGLSEDDRADIVAKAETMLVISTCIVNVSCASTYLCVTFARTSTSQRIRAFYISSF